MSNAYISTLNLISLFNPAVSAPNGINPNFPATNASDDLTNTKAADTPSTFFVLEYDFGTDVTADCAGIAGHNLHTVPDDGSWSVSYSDNGTDWTAWVNVTPIEQHEGSFFRAPTSQTHRYWRFNFSGDASGFTDVGLYVGVCWLSISRRMPVSVQPFAAPSENRNNRLLANFGGGGAFLGTGVIWQGGQSTYRFEDLTWDFFNNTFRRDYDRIVRGLPFFLSWDNVNYQQTAGYLFAPNNPSVQRKSHGRLDLSIFAQTV